MRGVLPAEGLEGVVHVGSCDPKDVLMTTTMWVGSKTLTQSFRPGDAEAVEKATNELAAFTMENIR